MKLSIEVRRKRAFAKLEKLGVPVYHLGSGFSGDAEFTISAEENTRHNTWADYYDYSFGIFGVNTEIIDILDHYDLTAQWYNPGVLEVYDDHSWSI